MLNVLDVACLIAIERYRQLTIEPATFSPKETGAFMAADRAALTELVRKAGIKLEP